MSYLSRHRPICAVLQEIRENTDDLKIIALVDEAIDYARRMSRRLMDYKRKEETKTCVECGDEFSTIYTRKVTCSDKCGHIRHLRLMKEWRLKNG